MFSLAAAEQGTVTQAPILIAGANLGVGILGLIIAYQRNKRPLRRLEAWIKESVYLPFNPVVMGAELRISDVAVKTPSYIILRLLNVGREAITEDDFVSPITVSLPRETTIVSVRSASRPFDVLALPEIQFSGYQLELSGVLLNATDLIEVHILGDGAPLPLAVSARIRDVPSIKIRKFPPYPPGVGPEGEMIHPFERFMMYGGSSLIGAMMGAAIPYFALFHRSYASTTTYVVSTVFLASVGVTLALWRVNVLKRRRALWVPEQRH